MAAPPRSSTRPKAKPGFSYWCANPGGDTGGGAAGCKSAFSRMKAFAVKLFKGKYPEAEICWHPPAPALVAGRLPRLASNLQPVKGREGWGKDREERDLLRLACLPARLPAGNRRRLKRDRIWPRTAQSSGSTTKQSTKRFSLLAEVLACRDHTTGRAQ